MKNHLRFVCSASLALAASNCSSGTLEESLANSILLESSVACAGTDALISSEWTSENAISNMEYQLLWKSQSESWSQASSTEWSPNTFANIHETKGEVIEMRVQARVNGQIVSVSNIEQVLACQAGSINQPPIANAGADVEIPYGPVVLDASGSTDSDGTIVSYLWEQVPGTYPVSMSNPSSPTITLNNFAVGFYQFQVTVTDDSGAFDSDIVQVRVGWLLPDALTSCMGTTPVVSIGWTPNGASFCPEPTEYKVYRRSVGATVWILTGTTENNFYEDTTQQPNSSLEYAIRGTCLSTGAYTATEPTAALVVPTCT